MALSNRNLVFVRPAIALLVLGLCLSPAYASKSKKWDDGPRGQSPL
jgi:hypothetical protein